ncbi:hypothetical protein QBC37DRAFT_397320 [Rhypophila decipiens]|uniref:Uncharacterized protein n=1 Tax=Rhypophila decipiens TaxID=261697 RepID=A0AAN7B8L2_9PEZI|nr:hypothetical protein QBC37DRAFT_397320 [Rhypophila decipiens]
MWGEVETTNGKPPGIPSLVTSVSLPWHQTTNNAEKAPNLSCSETNQNAVPQTYSIPAVELSDRREDQYDNTWPGCEHQNTGYYSHEDDQEHILELDPVTGKFVPQSDVWGRKKAMTDGSNESCRTGKRKNEDQRKTRYGTFHLHMGQMMVLMYSGNTRGTHVFCYGHPLASLTAAMGTGNTT